jgi:hypothetical protein
MSHILQIIPCSVPLYAIYKQDNAEFSTRVVCLALVEETEEEPVYRQVIGMEQCDDEIALVTTSRNFVRYSDKPIADPA